MKKLVALILCTLGNTHTHTQNLGVSQLGPLLLEYEDGSFFQNVCSQLPEVSSSGTLQHTKKSPIVTITVLLSWNVLLLKRDHYFTAVTWLVHHQVAVIWMNRVQNISIISLCQGPVWNCDLVSIMVFFLA